MFALDHNKDPTKLKDNMHVTLPDSERGPDIPAYLACIKGGMVMRPMPPVCSAH